MVRGELNTAQLWGFFKYKKFTLFKVGRCRLTL
jgi:hypothetical protein